MFNNYGKKMEDSLTSTEILEIALVKEKEAHEFYKEAARSIKDPNGKLLFTLFAVEEQKHVARLEFELIKAGKSIEQSEDLLGFEDLDFIVDITPDMKEIYLDILLGAINREDEAFKLFLSMLPIADSAETRTILEGLIEEEIRHKILLQMKYNHAKSQ